MKPPVVTISYSELQALRRCQFRHHMEYVQGWTKEKAPDSPAGFGTAWHDVLNAYYGHLASAYRTHYDSAWRKAREVIDEKPEGIQEPLRWMLEGYAAHYSNEPGWRVVAVERKLIVRLPQLRSDLAINLKCKIDLVIQDIKTHKVWVDDHKSKKQLPATSNSYRDPQLPLYMFAWNRTYPNLQAHGARYSYALVPGKRKRPLEDEWDKRFRRTPVPYTEQELETIARDAYQTAYQAYRNGSLSDYPPRSLSPDCSWCDYRDPCRLNLRGRDLDQGLTDYGFTRWRDEPKAPAIPDTDEETEIDVQQAG